MVLLGTKFGTISPNIPRNQYYGTTYWALGMSAMLPLHARRLAPRSAEGAANPSASAVAPINPQRRVV